MTKLDALKKQLSAALPRMDEVVQMPKSVLVRDAAIKRFEFTFDLTWKAMRAFLEERKGFTCVSPKECTQEAFRYGLIAYDDLWMRIPDWRNQIVHEYSEEFAEDLYRELPRILLLFHQLVDALQKQS
ncbi:MAG: HI0074 family nucleotidyltransferase substrate-binding subunit [Candidatus Sungiibacteriota bacterium]